MGPLPNQYFDSFPARQQAINDFIRAVGQAKLNDAQAQVQQALAASEFERAQMLQILVAQLASDLDDLNQTKATAAARVQDLASKSHACDMLLRGQQISDYQHSADAYKHFEMVALAEMTDDQATLLYATFPKPADTDWFSNNYNIPVVVFPSTINALSLMDWMLNSQLIAHTGSEAQHHVRQTFQMISNYVTQAVSQIRQHTDAIRTGTYAIWNPVQFTGNLSTAEKALMSATLPTKP